MVQNSIFLWLALAIIPLSWVGIVWRERQTKLLIKRLGIVEKLINLDNRRRRFHYFLRVGVIVCLLIALARPQWGVAEQVIVAEGVGVVWVLDVSRSMDVQDITPSRLERAKLTVNVVMGNNPVHQFGMVIFARDGFVQFPMTIDGASAQAIVQSISTDAIHSQGTDVLRAIEQGLALLDDRMIARGVVVLLSDGEQNRTSSEYDRVISQTVERGVPIYAIGYGTSAGGMIPDGDVFVQDTRGETVISRLEDTLLSQIATDTGGGYQVASSTGDEVAFVQGALDSMDRQVFERRSQLDYVARFPIFVALALMMLWIDGIVGNEKKHPIFDDVSHHSM